VSDGMEWAYFAQDGDQVWVLVRKLTNLIVL